jgi:hypothetical protein
LDKKFPFIGNQKKMEVRRERREREGKEKERRGRTEEE